MTRIAVLLTGVALLSGCATAPSYHNPNIVDPIAAKRQFDIDDGYCTGVSSGSVPMPMVRTYVPGQQAYTINGTGSMFTPGVGTSSYGYQARVTPVPNPGAAFATGMANGMNMGIAMRAAQDRQRVYHGCMVSLGWSNDPEVLAAASKPKAPAKEPAGQDVDEERWRQAIETFLDMEAASPGGIDYRKDPAKMDLLDATVRALGRDPRHQDKSMSWFLMEANRMVKTAYGQANLLESTAK